MVLELGGGVFFLCCKGFGGIFLRRILLEGFLGVKC